MRYDWEDEKNHPHVWSIGDANAHMEIIEGAFHPNEFFLGMSAMERADILQDVIGDLQVLYDDAVGNLTTG